MIRTVAYYGEQRRAYQLDWLAARRNKWFEENGPCKHCGSWDNLEVDHIIRRKIAGGLPSARIWSRSAEVRKRELANCQVLCESCHKAKTIEEQQTSEHGRAMYRRGCRCSFCKETMIVYWRARHALVRQRKLEAKGAEGAW